MSAIFVTAIGTDCGKTHVSAALLRELTAQQRAPVALKPLMSGYSPAALETSDAGRLLAACGQQVTPETVADVCWKSFTEWAAPNVAARNVGVALDYADLLHFTHMRLRRRGGHALVEGAGGVMSPLTDTHTNLDLMSDLGLPVLLMTTNYLGAVSHTLTALEVLQQRGLAVAAIALTQMLPGAGPAGPMIDELNRWTKLRIVEASFSRTPQEDTAWAKPLASLLFG